MCTIIDPCIVAVNVSPVADVSTGSCPGTKACMLLIKQADLHTVTDAAESKINRFPTTPSATESTSGIIFQSSQHKISRVGEVLPCDIVGGMSTTNTGIGSSVVNGFTMLDTADTT